MTAPTLSAYPKPVDELVPAARDLAAQLGTIPSRNRIKKELRVGGPKADAILAELTRTPPPAALYQGALARPVVAAASVSEAEPEVTPVPTGPATDPIEPTEPAPADPGPVVDPPPGDDDAPPPVAAQPAPVADPGTNITSRPPRPAVVWPVVLMALGAFVAVWSGWVGLGKLTGFGKVDLLPGIVEPGSWATIDSAITLPIGVEAYAAYALYVWLSGRVPTRARTFAKWSALASLAVGALGQVAYHLLVAYGVTAAPWWITTLVACLPVAVLGMGAALAHLVREAH
ncbi:ABC transporter permease [Micromonospora sp. HUAS LYJ1]|uniref:ABC transporter permease n=1 Tax=Micromonospora sp. HUAS LYJ1 TaxID=3061626 RepID=UPI00267318E9|nr:ABC transporter permease [Micromonospora sp. HUAS LYJ1]WKU02854.1 ABC transporter permease [Micromonospora sp. HUAS LYJ1]